MKKLNLILITSIVVALLPMSACASNYKANSTVANNQQLLIDKAQQSGVTFLSNGQHYQLIKDGYATTSSGSGNSAQSLSNTQNSALWSAQLGDYGLSINNPAAAQTLSSGSNSNTNSRKIAYNPRTGNVAIMSGKIVVVLTGEVSAEQLAQNYGINLYKNYPDMRIAFFSVNTGQDIFQMTNYLNADSATTSAQIDVTEHFRRLW